MKMDASASDAVAPSELPPELPPAQLSLIGSKCFRRSKSVSKTVKSTESTLEVEEDSENKTPVTLGDPWGALGASGALGKTILGSPWGSLGTLGDKFELDTAKTL